MCSNNDVSARNRLPTYTVDTRQRKGQTWREIATGLRTFATMRIYDREERTTD